jgi:hypothetical protein
MFAMNARGSFSLVGALMVLIVTVLSCSSADDNNDSQSAQDTGVSDFVVYQTPWCGCCSKWVDHLRENGFVVRTEEVTDIMRVKLKHNVGREISSCHTAVVEGYVIEGHVPADLIKRLLEERPPVAGLTVPGMPMGSPGMEGPYKQPYETLTFDRKGNTEIYARR